MQDFERLHTAVEAIDQKMNWYAVMLQPNGIKKILHIVRDLFGLTVEDPHGRHRS